MVVFELTKKKKKDLEEFIIDQLKFGIKQQQQQLDPNDVDDTGKKKQFSTETPSHFIDSPSSKFIW